MFMQIYECRNSAKIHTDYSNLYDGCSLTLIGEFNRDFGKSRFKKGTVFCCSCR